MIYNVSVMVGDSILLPILNYKIFNLFLNYVGIESIKKYRKILITWFFAAFIISLFANISAHLVWVNDALTDFVGFKKGEFSIIGIWHLIYSIFQMLIIFMFPFFWFVAIKEKNDISLKYSHHIWKFVLIFSTLAIFDMLNKYFFIYHDKSLLYAMQVDIFAFSTVIMSLMLFYIMKYIEKRKMGIMSV
ncbi:MAG: hypothetical protein NTZ33_02365 [Bacteroidetes bacterium]|nr:hypothetical protein [Bacteroidota bacterium]